MTMVSDDVKQKNAPPNSMTLTTERERKANNEKQRKTRKEEDSK